MYAVRFQGQVLRKYLRGSPQGHWNRIALDRMVREELVKDLLNGRGRRPCTRTPPPLV